MVDDLAARDGVVGVDLRIEAGYGQAGEIDVEGGLEVLVGEEHGKAVVLPR